MLTVTATAVVILRSVLAQHGTGPHSGLRLAVNDDTPGEPGFQLSLCDEPLAGDQVAVTEPRVYVDSAAIGPLHDQVLDAEHPDPAGLRVVPRAA